MSETVPPRAADRDYVLKVARDLNVHFIQLWFTDILGHLKSVAVTHSQLEDALESGVSFDGSSILGFARREESDMLALPDPETFQLIPWRSREEGAVARMFCNISTPDHEAYEGDPRWILRRTIQRATDLGYTFYVGPELEFFYFRSSDGPPQTLDDGGYFDLTSQDMGSDLRRDTILTLEQMGIDVDFSHHEVAHSQHEIDLRHTDALAMADSTMTYRLVVKQVAQRAGVYATFMPKPLQDQNGNGMHINTSLFKGSVNAFYDSEQPDKLSKVARHYIAGLLRHVRELTLVFNQWVNSYKRLVPGYEAPTCVSWAFQNRSDLIRIPRIKADREEGVRVELRSPDPACNPYLAFAVILAAGLEGLEHEYELPAAMEEDVMRLSPAERDKRGIQSLPENLLEAIQAAQQSELLRKTLGDHAFNSLIENKVMEWNRFRAQVTDYELREYLPIL